MFEGGAMSFSHQIVDEVDVCFAHFFDSFSETDSG